MALGSCGHRITHQLRPINMNGRSILSETSNLPFPTYSHYYTDASASRPTGLSPKRRVQISRGRISASAITRPDRTQNASATHSRPGKAGSLNLLWAIWRCRGKCKLTSHLSYSSRSEVPSNSLLAGASLSRTEVPGRSLSPVDFVSRFFAPRVGVDEDPVCGSAHCCLGPFWASKLGRTELTGHQVSPRGRVVKVRVDGPRMALIGQAVTVLRGELLD